MIDSHCQPYPDWQSIQHLTFNLDDGVKVNYQKLVKALKSIK